MMADDKNGATFVLRFPRELARRSVISELVGKYGLGFNILLARITPREEGLMALRLVGDDGAVGQGKVWLEQLGVWSA